jgi:hypothetical protein
MEVEKIANHFNAHKAGMGWTARRPAYDDQAARIVRPSLARQQHGAQP